MLLDRFTKTILVLIALLLTGLVVRPIAQPVSVRAQASEAYPFFIEPGVTTIRKPDGTGQVFGKMVVDMRTGDIWGFPTLTQSPYPIDAAQTKPPISRPTYLGKFMFDQAKR